HVRPVYSIGHRTSRFDVLTGIVDRRQSRDERQGVDANSVGQYERVASDIKGLRAAIERLERGRDIFGAPNFECHDIEAERAGGRLNLVHLQCGDGITDIRQAGQPAQTWDNLAQEFESLASKIGCQGREAGDVAARSRKATNKAGANRIPHYRGDDRDNPCRLLCCNDRWGRIRDNDVDLELDELGRDLGEALAAALRPAILDSDGAALGPPEF